MHPIQNMSRFPPHSHQWLLALCDLNFSVFFKTLCVQIDLVLGIFQRETNLNFCGCFSLVATQENEVFWASMHLSGKLPTATTNATVSSMNGCPLHNKGLMNLGLMNLIVGTCNLVVRTSVVHLCTSTVHLQGAPTACLIFLKIFGS